MVAKRIAEYILSHPDEDVETAYAKYVKIYGASKDVDKQLLTYRAFRIFYEMPKDKLADVIEIL